MRYICLYRQFPAADCSRAALLLCSILGSVPINQMWGFPSKFLPGKRAFGLMGTGPSCAAAKRALPSSIHSGRHFYYYIRRRLFFQYILFKFEKTAALPPQMDGRPSPPPHPGRAFGLRITFPAGACAFAMPLHANGTSEGNRQHGADNRPLRSGAPAFRRGRTFLIFRRCVPEAHGSPRIPFGWKARSAAPEQSAHRGAPGRRTPRPGREASR